WAPGQSTVRGKSRRQFAREHGEEMEFTEVRTSAPERSVDASFTPPAVRAGFSSGWPVSRKGLGAIAFATLLAGCGGGGGGSSDGGGGVTPDLPPPETCLSQVGGGTGYAVGACINPIAARFLAVQTDVEIRGQS